MPFPRSPELMSRDDSALLVVDVQEKLIGLIPEHQRIVWNIGRLIDAAGILGVPVAGTEQYPQGLGETLPQLREKLPAWGEKRDFSCLQCEDIFTQWRDAQVFNVLVVGIETHVCVLQTALDLLATGFHVHVAIDAVGSRFDTDRQTALRRLESSGATLSTTETAIFEWCATSTAPEFRQISKLVRETMPE
ncbi:MAG: isochorismatase family protein [Pirellulales bacterium]|nr:isochorismatase family protein [Pirellulales bacterium]